MANTIKIFVEGIADVKFLRDYISHITPNFGIVKETIIDTGGWTSIDSQKEKGESIQNQMRQNTDNGGINLVVFDADKDFGTRKQEIEAWKSKYNLAFELFLLPNNQDIGALEDLLEKIIIDNN
jgi:predicted GTPase